MMSDQDERLVIALELLSGAMASIAKTLELEYSRKYPVKKWPSEPTITYILTEEERLREEQGQTGELSTEDWTSLGPRERAFVEEKTTRKR